MSDFREGWNTRQKILVILAHPDDPEFFMGATIARWTSGGHEVQYVLLTRGDKGSNDRTVDPMDLAARREGEQTRAAQVLGVHAIQFLEYLDGCLMPSMELRKAVAKVIRQVRPDILITCDPTNFFPNEAGINHPDHRTAGQVVVDGYFPAAGNPHFFPELLTEGLEPHSVKEIWLTVTSVPNTIIDVTPFWDQKIKALKEHQSQIGDPKKLEERIRSRHTPDTTMESPRYEEKFRRFIFVR